MVAMPDTNMTTVFAGIVIVMTLFIGALILVAAIRKGATSKRRAANLHNAKSLNRKRRIAGTCSCEGEKPPANQFEHHNLGEDRTDGRFVEVTSLRCRKCDRLWLQCFVEYEGFAKSGRWARGLIDETTAATMTPKKALKYFDSLPWYICGGSYFDGHVSRRSGPIEWWNL
jgi:hypothetical protein